MSKDFAKRFPSDTPLEVYGPSSPPPAPDLSGQLHLDQSTPQTFTNGTVTGSGLLKVTSGTLGLDTTTYLTSYNLDGGSAVSTYGGTSAIDGGGA